MWWLRDQPIHYQSSVFTLVKKDSGWVSPKALTQWRQSKSSSWTRGTWFSLHLLRTQYELFVSSRVTQFLFTTKKIRMILNLKFLNLESKVSPTTNGSNMILQQRICYHLDVKNLEDWYLSKSLTVFFKVSKSSLCSNRILPANFLCKKSTFTEKVNK